MACHQRQRLFHLRLRDCSTATTMPTDNSNSSTSLDSSMSSAATQNNSSSTTYAVLGRIASWILERERQQCSLDVNVPYDAQSRYFRPVEVASSIERLMRRCEASLSAVESVLVRKDGGDHHNKGRQRPSDTRGGTGTGLWLLLSATNLESECLMALLHLAVAMDVPMAWASLIVAAIEIESSDDDDDIPNVDELHYVNEKPQLLYPWLIQEASINGSQHTLKLLLENAPALVDGNGDSTHDAARENARHMNAPPFRPCRMARSDAMQFLERLASTMQLLESASVESPWGKDGWGKSSSHATDDILHSPSSFHASHTSLSSFGQFVPDLTAVIEEWDECTQRIRSSPDDPAVEPTCTQALLRSSMVRSSMTSAREGTGAQIRLLRASVTHLLLSPPCGSSPLHWASYKGYVECAALLLERGADPNAVAIPTGWTPLHDAAYSNSTQVMELLLDAGANVNATAASGATPLCFACQEDAAEAASLLLKHQAAILPVVHPAGTTTTRSSSAPLLPNSGLTVMPPPPFAVASTSSLHPPPLPLAGYTPLHYCARFNSARAARVLLSHCQSADVSYSAQPTCCHQIGTSLQRLLDAPDFNGRRSIDIACIRASVDVLYELLHHGATVGTGSRNARSSNEPNAFPAAIPTPVAPRTVSDLRSMIPKEPVVAPKPWNCLTQESIDGCHALLDRIDGGWNDDCHDLYTPEDRAAVDAIRTDVSDDLERARGVYRDVWPVVLSYCGRGWFRPSSAADEVGKLECGIVGS